MINHTQLSPVYFSIKITTSVYPIPSICRFDQLGDWFESLADILHWNLREPQLSLVADRPDRARDYSPTENTENSPEKNINSPLASTSESSEDV